MNRNLLLGLVLLASLGCVAPRVVPNTQAKDFHLTDLKTQRVAVFPIASADLDESASKTVADEYKTKDAFLDALSNKFSARLLSVCKEPSLTSEKVQSLLVASETTKSLLDPVKVLGTQGPNNRFSDVALPPGINTLAQLQGFQGVRFAVVARDLSVGRQWSHSSSAGGGFVSSGFGGGTFVGGGSSSSAMTSARLRLAILDLDAKAIVWDGAVFADASSTFMKATALHEVEEDLATHFINEILGIK